MDRNRSNATIEELILQQGHRGMDVLRPLLPADYCRRGAEELNALPRGRVLLTTGFYVNGAAESDGPAGTACLAFALQKLSFSAVILASEYCRGFFEPLGLETLYYGPDDPPEPALLDRLSPVALISIETCGHTADGDYENMRGRSIRAHTAALDSLFPLAREKGVYTLGVGDGGNEIGMGNVQDAVRGQLGLEPSVVQTDRLVIAAVSNGGAYGLSAALGVLNNRDLLPREQWIEEYLPYLAGLGCVDGVTGLAEPTVDGFPAGTERQVFADIRAWELSEIARQSAM